MDQNHGSLSFGRKALIAIAAVFFAFFLWNSWALTKIVYYRFADPKVTPYMEREAGRLKEEKPELRFNARWADKKQISRHMKCATIQSEDKYFYRHNGVDWESFRRAVERYVNGVRGGGGSTIAMQVTKNLLLTHERSVIRKAREIVLALVLEAVWSKDRVLEVYLNTAEFGEGVFGVKAAAERYFQTAPDRLSPEQAAFLVSLLPNPRYYEYHQDHMFRQNAAAVLRHMKTRAGLCRKPKK